MMILDTNVFSEFTRLQPNPAVISWLDLQVIDEVWITAITTYEIRFGINSLPQSKKRAMLDRHFRSALQRRLGGRVLPFDLPASEAAGSIGSMRRREGRPIDIRDTQIAGIALSRKARLATRNIRHFDGLGIDIVNPWEAA